MYEHNLKTIWCFNRNWTFPLTFYGFFASPLPPYFPISYRYQFSFLTLRLIVSCFEKMENGMEIIKKISGCSQWYFWQKGGIHKKVKKSSDNYCSHIFMFNICFFVLFLAFSVSLTLFRDVVNIVLNITVFDSILL